MQLKRPRTRTLVYSVVVSILSVAIRADIVAQETIHARNVVIVAIDGARWQEVFGPGRDTLMPFLWSVVAREGQLFGNRALGSRMRVTNRLNFSYPGYQEMLAGYPDPRIDNNHFGRNPNVTVLEFLNRQPELVGRVAAFVNWKVIDQVFARRGPGFLVSAGGERGEEVMPDAQVHRRAMRHVAEAKPRVLFIGFGEGDGEAHAGRFDRYVGAIRDADRFIGELWAALQADSTYRGRTTLIVTTDHGRGRGKNWPRHGWRTRGSGETWLAIIGPGTPALGERSNTSTTTSQVAATIAAALGYDYRAAVPRAATAIPSR